MANILRCSDLFGSMESRLVNVFRDGVVDVYGYSIKYDRRGIEISRTKPEYLSTLLIIPTKRQS